MKTASGPGLPSVAPLGESQRAWAAEVLEKRWGSAYVVSRGRVHDASRLPGFVAIWHGDAVGLATYHVDGGACELVTLDALKPRLGIGSALLSAVEKAAREQGCWRMWLVTTNDNVDALRFYQRHGLCLVAVHRNAVAASRVLKPSIPESGLWGIPLRDEIELERRFEGAAGAAARTVETRERLRPLRQVCVFCGSSDSVGDEYLDAARAMGRCLAKRGITLVYGGGGTGLMGALADAALASGGRVIGVLPRSFDTPRLAHGGLRERRIVGSMHERKAMMAEMGEAFVALPGGFGTLEELFEILTWAQIGLHRRPVGLLNVAGYFEPLLAAVEHARAEGFIYKEHRSLLLAETEPERLLDRLAAYRPPEGLDRWLTREEVEV